MATGIWPAQGEKAALLHSYEHVKLLCDMADKGTTNGMLEKQQADLTIKQTWTKNMYWKDKTKQAKRCGKDKRQIIKLNFIIYVPTKCEIGIRPPKTKEIICNAAYMVAKASMTMSFFVETVKVR